ncbi:MAG: 5-oxoprolinase subunit PxpB [Rhodobacteraceae bacterium]|jgi:KipI family sensor histidine kinase inhibitor|nr:5-oxoprolinase subunit PxpB [Paracoccaceae bacterium]
MADDPTIPGAPRLLPLGDAGLSVEFGDDLDPALTARVLALDAALAADPLPGVVETVPTYRALMLHLDPLAADLDVIARRVAALAGRPPPAVPSGRLWRVPVVYGGEFGADLAGLAAARGLTEAAAVALHAAPVYTVAMIGFVPGFSYLAGLDPRLATPRRPVPRPVVPASSVAIGGGQTSIGSIPAPSGWHLIGRTPVRPFLAGRNPPFLFAPGDRIRLVPLPAAAWEALDARAAAGDPVAGTETAAVAGPSGGAA